MSTTTYKPARQFECAVYREPNQKLKVDSAINMKNKSTTDLKI